MFGDDLHFSLVTITAELFKLTAFVYQEFIYRYATKLDYLFFFKSLIVIGLHIPVMPFFKVIKNIFIRLYLSL